MPILVVMGYPFVVMKETNSIIDYALSFRERFSTSLPTETDYAIFAKLSYFDYGVYLPLFGDSASSLDFSPTKNKEFLDRIAYSPKDLTFINALRGNPRFNEVRVLYFDNIFNPSNNEQFSAVCFFIPSLNRLIVAYRGTDSTLVGWKEDFDMSFLTPIPAQNDAGKYLSTVSSLSKDCYIVIVGHSKGGNLACYAYLSASKETQERILSVYSFDGPGLNDSIEGVPFLYHDPKVFHYVPYESIIGNIYDPPVSKIVVSSNGRLLRQHSLYEWVVGANGLFLKREHMSPFLEEMSRYFNVWVKEITPEERELIVNSMYDLVIDSDIHNAKEVVSRKAASLKRLYQEYKKLPKEKREKLGDLFSSLRKRLLEGLK